MFLVGLTGGIATGKSSVATFLRNMGIEIVDSDLVAREVVEPSKVVWKKIRKEFGESVFHSDGTVNRKALGQIIFTQPEKRQLLNSITHPEIYKSILRKCVRLFFAGNQFAVIDIPLLYESGKMVKYLHKTIVVACESSIQLERLMSRDNISKSDAMARINAQMPLSEKIKQADFIINNNGNKESTQIQVENIVKELQNLKTHWKYRFVIIVCTVIPFAALGYGIFKFLNYLR